MRLGMRIGTALPRPCRFRMWPPLSPVLASLLLGCAPANGPPATGGQLDPWVRFDSASAGFSASYPGRQPDFVEENGVHIFRVEYANGNRVLSVRYYPVADTNVPLRDRLDRSCSALKATKVVIRDVETNGQRGMEASFESNAHGPQLALRNQVFYRRGAMYQIMGVRRVTEGESDIDRFFAEFHFNAEWSPPEEDLASARKSFVTKLKVHGPAPQPYHNEPLPPGVQRVEYTSGDLKLKGWLSAAPISGKLHPAVVFLHGGFAFASEDWADAAPFAEAGFVLFAPTFRGENGNPGAYESFYGEVDDAIAAGRYVSALPYVDGTNVFVVGHSSGAVLTCLVAMMPSPYKAAVALDGAVEMESWAKSSPGALVPYDPSDAHEVRVRNPLAFAGSLRCPLTLYATETGRRPNESLASRARSLGKPCELVLVSGGHAAMVAPAVQKAIAQFRAAEK